MNILHWISGFLQGKQTLSKEEVEELRAKVSSEIMYDTKYDQLKISNSCQYPESCGMPTTWYGILSPTCEKCGRMGGNLSITY